MGKRSSKKPPLLSAEAFQRYCVDGGTDRCVERDATHKTGATSGSQIFLEWVREKNISPLSQGKARVLKKTRLKKRVEKASNLDLRMDEAVPQRLASVERPSTPVMRQEEGRIGYRADIHGALLKKLKRGHVPFRMKLDLHGQTQEEAYRLLIQFIERARGVGERCVLVVTGKGQHSPHQWGILRQSLPEWLTTWPLSACILAFSTAQDRDGGEGAFYLLLRRSRS